MQVIKWGRLTFFGRMPNRNSKVMYQCICDCGSIGIYRREHLMSGATRSCGCLIIDFCKSRATHGETRSPEWNAWTEMKRRCLCPTNKAYRYYGGRGIKICDRWSVFENFLADMGRKTSSRHSLERNDVNGNYEPSNCRWATRTEQARNKTTTKLNADIAAAIVELATEGISKIEISRRLNLNYSSVKAVVAGRQWKPTPLWASLTYRGK